MKGPKASECRKWHLHFQNFPGGGGGGMPLDPPSKLPRYARSVRAKISHLSIFKTCQHCNTFLFLASLLGSGLSAASLL